MTAQQEELGLPNDSRSPSPITSGGEAEGGLLAQVATEADLAAVVAVVNAAYRGIGSRPGWTSEVELLDGPRVQEATLRAEMAGKPEARILVLRDKATAEVTGCVLLEPAGDATWYLGMLSIRPDLQDRGMGRTLLSSAERMAASHGTRRIRMTVIEARDSLIAWYFRRGYAPTGEDAAFPYHDPSVGRPRCADLRFVVLEKTLPREAER